jgi:HPt (histidine-containing phosphotransfer) domain-containing protein
MDLSELVSKCQDRNFLSSFFEGRIEYEERNIDFGQTDLATMEKCLSAVEEKESITVFNPFSDPLLPVLISYSYMFSSEPNLTSNINEGLPMILFPYQGYIQEYDNFHYSNGTELDTVMSKENVDSEGDIKSKHVIYRATETEILTSEYKNIGLAFIDLRKNAWKEKMDRIEEFISNNYIDSVVFYTDEKDYGYDVAKDLSSEVFEVSGELMTQSEVDSEGENPTKMRKQESVFSRDFEFNIVEVDEEEIVARFNNLYEMLQKFSENDIEEYSARKLFNLLSNLVTSPNKYDKTASGNYYFQTVSSLTRSLESKADNLPSPRSDLVRNYLAEAEDLIETLNETNPKSNIILKLNEEAKKSEKETLLITKNKIHKEALEEMLAEEKTNLESPILTKNEVTPSKGSVCIYLFAPWKEENVYEFPPANTLIFSLYPFERNLVEGALEENCPSNYDLKSRKIIGTSEDYDLDIENIREESARSVLSGNTSPQNNSAKRKDTGESVNILLQGDEEVSYNEREIVTVLDKDKNTVKRKKSKDLNEGDELVVLSDAREDLYSLLVKKEHKREKIENKEALIQKWRSILQKGLETKGWDYDRLLKELQEKGSEISSSLTVRNWAKGDVMGPQKKEDVHRVLEIFRPEYESLAPKIYQSMKYIRIEHRKLARQVRSLIESKVDPMSSVSNDLNKEKLKRIEENLEVKRVINASGS